jgi:hypothetical protein
MVAPPGGKEVMPAFQPGDLKPTPFKVVLLASLVLGVRAEAEAKAAMANQPRRPPQ